MRDYAIRVVKSKRRSVSIKVLTDLSVEVRTPLRFKESELSKVLDRFHPWICKKREEIASLPKVRELTFNTGDLVPILGKDYPVVIEIANKRQASFTKGTLLLSVTKTMTDAAILKLGMTWYRDYAREVIESRVRHFTPQFKKMPNKIMIKSLKSRWGSCSTTRNLNFNWKLVMTPLSVLDYVVIHEMCHMLEMNHGPQFWAEVKARDPDYSHHKAWLRTHGRLL